MIELSNIFSLRGEITVPGDKSISHRAVMFASIAKGVSHISNFLNGADCLATIECFRRLGIEIEQEGDKVTVHGKGLRGLQAPSAMLEVGNSGTTTRLMAGILAGQNFEAKVSGDESLNSRPMNRIIEPLTQMEANVASILRNDCAPLFIAPAELKGIHYESKVASAQVKSCILLAGLYAEGETKVTEPSLSRNHTELMLKDFGADIDSSMEENGKATATIRAGQELMAKDIVVPGDISSAAYFIAAGLLVDGSKITIKNVGINPTRSGFIQVCQDMGGDVQLLQERNEGGEAVADLQVQTSQLKGITIEGDIIPRLIDEIPMIAVMAACAKGTTIIKDAAELRVKETDRIETISENLKAMDADVTPTADGLIIKGGQGLKGATIHPFLDHRIAMAFSIAALVAEGNTKILDSQCVDVSYPNFYDTFEELL